MRYIDNVQANEDRLSSESNRILELVKERNFVLSCKYNHFFEITNYFINDIQITQDDLICELAMLFEDQETETYMSDNEYDLHVQEDFLQKIKYSA